MEHKATRSEIKSTLWPKRLVEVRRSLNRSSRIIVFLGLLGLAGCAIWVTYERRTPGGIEFNMLEVSTWFHPAYINSVLIAIMILYAMRQINRTRQKLNPLGYPMIERIDAQRHVEIWRSVEPLSGRPVFLHVIAPEKYPGDRRDWDEISGGWIRRATKARRLSSPHIAQLLDTGYAQNDRFYAAIEMARGMRLDDFINRFGAMPVDRGLFLLAQLAHAIHDAHDRGISPLQIKPANIWIGQRSSNEDWLTLVLFSYELDELQNGESVPADLRKFAKIAVSILTGQWISDDESPNLEAIDAALDSQGVPYLIRDQLRRTLTAGRLDPLPPANEIMRRLWEAHPGVPWNNDRAAAWWREHKAEAV